MTWTVYYCDNAKCSGFGFHWPVAENEDGSERKCPTCGRMGAVSVLQDAPNGSQKAAKGQKGSKQVGRRASDS